MPFAWETEASGIHRVWLERGWYRRSVEIPASWTSGRAIVHFGAVNHRARVWANGTLLGEHVGGYTPFEFDLSAIAAAGETVELVVRVDAPNDKRDYPHGKQRSLPRDDYHEVAFTPTSGIWQTVWLEQRPERHIARVRLDGSTRASVTGTITLSGSEQAEVAVRVLDADGRVATDATVVSGAPFEIPLTAPRLWSPDDPHLYVVELAIDGDVVVTLVGLRSFEIDGETFLLNGERIYLRGLLDQGYWPRTGMTAPTAEALRHDLDLARDAGYNLVRKHIKLEDPIWLHEADRSGMLVWAEPPCPSRFGASAVAEFEELAVALIDRDRGHPSIVIWAAYNEEWGLDWDLPGSAETRDAARRAYRLMTEADPTRPVIANSGWAHLVTDIVDWHHYVSDPETWARTVRGYADGSSGTIPIPLGSTPTKEIYADPSLAAAGLPIINSEYGTGHTSVDRGWQLRWQTQELRRHDRFAGYVYCELTDIEHEMAGFANFDRSAKDLGNVDLAHVNAETVLVIDIVPVEPGRDLDSDGSPFTVGVRVSHHGRDAVTSPLRAEWTPLGTPASERRGGEPVTAPVTVEPFRVTDAVAIMTALPAGWTDGRLFLTFGDGRDLAVAFLDVGPVERRPWERAPHTTTGTDTP